MVSLANQSDQRSMLPRNPVILEAVPARCHGPWINLTIPTCEIFRRTASKSLYDSANLRITEDLCQRHVARPVTPSCLRRTVLHNRTQLPAQRKACEWSHFPDLARTE